MNLNRLVFANLKFNAGRTAGLAFIVAVLSFVLLGGSLVMSSLENGIKSLEARLGADVIVAPMTALSHNDLDEILLEGIPGQFYMDASNLDKVAQIEGVQAASPQYYLATVKAGCCSMPVQIIGFDPQTDFAVQPWIARTYGGALERGQVVVGCNISGGVGSGIQFYGVGCEIASKLEETGTKLDNAVFARSDTVQDLIAAAIDLGFPPDSHEDASTMISTIQVKVADGYDPEAVAGDINLHVRGLKAVTAKTMTSALADSVAGISRVVRALTAVLWVVAVIVLVATFVVVNRHRAREFAVLRAIGASQSALARVVVKEAAVVSLAGALVGIAAASAIVFAFNGALESALGVPFLMPPASSLVLFCILTFAVALIIGPAAAAISAKRLSSVDAGQVLREG